MNFLVGDSPFTIPALVIEKGTFLGNYLSFGGKKEIVQVDVEAENGEIT